jgi:hypothetical protein
VRWVETKLLSRAEEARDATLVHETNLLARRIDGARAALVALKDASTQHG